MSASPLLDRFNRRATLWSDWLLAANKVHPTPPPLIEGRWPGDEAIPSARALLRDGIELNEPQFLRPLLKAFAEKTEDLVSLWVRPYLDDPASASPTLRRQVLALARAATAAPGWAAALGAYATEANDEALLDALCQGEWVPDAVDEHGRNALHALALGDLRPAEACRAAAVLTELGVPWEQVDDQGLTASDRFRIAWSPGLLTDAITARVYPNHGKSLPAAPVVLPPVWDPAERAAAAAARGQLGPLDRLLAAPDLDPHAYPERNPLLHRDGLHFGWVGSSIDASPWGVALSYGRADQVQALIGKGANPTRSVQVIDHGRLGVRLGEEVPLIAVLARQNPQALGVLTVLVENGARIRGEDTVQAGRHRGDTLLHLIATWPGSGRTGDGAEAVGMLRVLTDHQPRLAWQAHDRQGTPPLHRALRAGNAAIAEAFLASGPASLSVSRDAYLENPLHALVQGGWNDKAPELARRLQVGGAKWDDLNEVGESARDQISRRPAPERAAWYALAEAAEPALQAPRHLDPRDARRIDRETGFLKASVAAEYRHKSEAAHRILRAETAPTHSLANENIDVPGIHPRPRTHKTF